jgi:DNA-directed RNA polymerase subunit beta'
MKDLLNLLKQQSQSEEFDAIRIGLASPKMVRSWSYGEVKNQKPLTTVHLSLNAKVYFAAKFLVQLKTMNVCVVNTNV